MNMFKINTNLIKYKYLFTKTNKTNIRTYKQFSNKINNNDNNQDVNNIQDEIPIEKQNEKVES